MLKRDRAFVRGTALISYCLIWRYDGPTTFSNCGARIWFLSISSRRLPIMAALAFFALWEHFLRSGRVVFLHLMLQKTIVRWTSMRNWWLNEQQITDANFAVKLSVHAVCEAHSLRTLAFIWNSEFTSYQAVKPQHLNGTRRLFRSGTYSRNMVTGSSKSKKKPTNSYLWHLVLFGTTFLLLLWKSFQTEPNVNDIIMTTESQPLTATCTYDG